MPVAPESAIMCEGVCVGLLMERGVRRGGVLVGMESGLGGISRGGEALI